jgi:hypothetical protein
VGTKTPEEAVVELTMSQTDMNAHLYNNGTPAACRGDLLVAIHMLIAKKYNAKPADLDAAVKTGKMIQVGVDAGGRGGLVPTAQFLQAWQKMGSAMVVPQ